jgi:dimethylhistidine N-methyltransferase
MKNSARACRPPFASRPARARGDVAEPAAMDQALREEVLRGLRAPRKTLPPKLFYDDRGARLFEAICALPEYYPTRVELEILRAHLDDIARLAGPRCAMIEYGSGAGVKTRLLLEALEPVSYTAIEISEKQLFGVTQRLRERYPRIEMHPVCADYTRPFTLPPLPPHDRRLAVFPGSTIGNFHPAQATAFLRNVRDLVGQRGAMLLGVDRRKDRRILEAAYNDATGVTAAFNLNMLARLNREMDAGFDLSRFRHHAFFNEEAGRIEMHLVSTIAQTVHVGGEPIRFEAGESIWTESSYKYDRAALDRMVAGAGFSVDCLFSDPDDRFWVAWLSGAIRAVRDGACL